MKAKCLVPVVAFLFLAGGLQGAFFGIVTLAMAFIVERLAINWDYAGGLNGLMNVPPINTGLNGGGAEVYDAWPLYYINLAVLAAGIGVLAALMRSRYGLVLRAIRGHEARTRMLGYDINVSMSGTYVEPRIAMSSVPPLPQGDLMMLGADFGFTFITISGTGDGCP